MAFERRKFDLLPFSLDHKAGAQSLESKGSRITYLAIPAMGHGMVVLCLHSIPTSVLLIPACGHFVLLRLVVLNKMM